MHIKGYFIAKNSFIVEVTFKWMKTLLLTVFFQPLYLIVFLFCLHLCILSHFKIITSTVKSLITTSRYFLLKYNWKRKSWKVFVHPNRYPSLPDDLNTSLLLIKSVNKKDRKNTISCKVLKPSMYRNSIYILLETCDGCTKCTFVTVFSTIWGNGFKLFCVM